MLERQVQRLKKDSKELQHYIYKLNKTGRNELAYKLERKQQFLTQHINEMQSQ